MGEVEQVVLPRKWSIRIRWSRTRVIADVGLIHILTDNVKTREWGVSLSTECLRRQESVGEFGTVIHEDVGMGPIGKGLWKIAKANAQHTMDTISPKKIKRSW